MMVFAQESERDNATYVSTRKAATKALCTPPNMRRPREYAHLLAGHVVLRLRTPMCLLDIFRSTPCSRLTHHFQGQYLLLLPDLEELV